MCFFCSSMGKSLQPGLISMNLNRVDPEAVTEEDSDTALYCAWQNDDVPTMAVLAEVAESTQEMRNVSTFRTLIQFSNPNSGEVRYGGWWRRSRRGGGRGRCLGS